MARFGAVFALLVDAMAEIWEALPMVLMGSIAVLAGICGLFLPETVGLPLPQTVQDALNINKNSRGMCTCTCRKAE